MRQVIRRRDDRAAGRADGAVERLQTPPAAPAICCPATVATAIVGSAAPAAALRQALTDTIARDRLAAGAHHPLSPRLVTLCAGGGSQPAPNPGQLVIAAQCTAFAAPLRPAVCQSDEAMPVASDVEPTCTPG